MRTNESTNFAALFMGIPMPQTDATTFSYDVLGRLTSKTVSRGGGLHRTESYTYDNWDNIVRTSIHPRDTGVLTVSEMQYDAANRLISRTDQTSDINIVTHTFTHDACGNMLEERRNGVAQRHMRYDALGRKSSVTYNRTWTTTSFRYATNGNLVAAQGTNYVWDRGTIAAESSGSGWYHYLRGSGVYGLISASGAVEYYHWNAMGNVAFTSNFAGSRRREYEAYGRRIGESQGRGLGFHGYLFIPSVGIYFVHARWYCPSKMRFTQEDSFHWDNFAMNFHGYVSGDPVNFFDPTGHWRVKINPAGHAGAW
jgi:RHS repeat-associated protein